MKFKITILFLLAVLLNLTNSRADELFLDNSEWDELKKLAQESNKIIFVDAYNDWCMWCKVMQNETYTNDTVIDFLKQNFISAKYDMDVGFGKALAMKYRLRAFPKQLFFKRDGKLIYISSGFRETDRFIKILEKVLDEKEHWKAPGISEDDFPFFPPFYEAEFSKFGSNEHYTPSNDEIIAYLEPQDDLFSEINWSVLAVFETNEKYDSFFLDNFDKYKQNFDEFSVFQKFYKIVYKKLNLAIENNNNDYLNEVLEMIDKYDTQNASEMKFYQLVFYYDKTKNWAKYVEIIESNRTKDFFVPKLLIDYSVTLSKNCNEKELLKQAVLWMRNVKNIKNVKKSYNQLLALSNLFYKTGELNEALNYANEALEFGKLNRNNTYESENMISKINEEIKALEK